MLRNYVRRGGAAMGGRFALLLVASHPAERARLRGGLGWRFAVVEAGNADEAIWRLSTAWFDGVLADYALGRRTGAWLLEYVGTHYPGMWRALLSQNGAAALSRWSERDVVCDMAESLERWFCSVPRLRCG